VIAAVLLVTACSQSADRLPSANSSNVAATAPRAATPVPSPGTGPDARTPLAQPAKAADPKSTQAAVEIARTFADLLNRQKFNEAYMLLGPRSGFTSPADLREHFVPYSHLRITIEDWWPPVPEGAAGSIYLSVHANISGTVGGRHVDHPATISMRRVNDVPGSTEAQRRWHIESFDDTVM
jgi:hypothetical protein